MLMPAARSPRASIASTEACARSASAWRSTAPRAFAVGNGVPKRTRMVPGRTWKNPSGYSTAPDPAIATGTTSTPASIAAWNAPPLNAATSPLRLRVPSGKMHRLAPLRTSSVDWRRNATAARRLLRSMNTMPIAFAYQPTNGTWVISCLSRKCSGTGTARNIAQMSMVDWWLATKTWLRDQSTWSSPSTSSRAPAPHSSPGAQQREAIRNGQWRSRVTAYSSSARLIQIAVHSRVKPNCTALNAVQA